MDDYNNIVTKLLLMSKGVRKITLKKHWIVFGEKTEIPNSGIKIHISNGNVISAKFIMEVAEQLNKNNCIWKIPNNNLIASFIVNPDNNSIIKGKLITVYPRDFQEFYFIIKKLIEVKGMFENCINIKDEHRWRKSRIFYRKYNKEEENLGYGKHRKKV
ncbi:hypothetical protein QL049_03505 [Staphylococcus pseudintermedius]|uniref:class III lanthionine synthetase LanKC N-terminal domain-containing protein n=1 Tax=Staphylococcus pseudintermedius TaxID=283734 RepID=UPI00283AB23A|nr:hypothetical protein [Staphylococcus pseudintermedius]WMV87366.1 hypothetical protein QL049_03505 [Staphylococcus pseudintermedius]